jgi:hypothetical protein
MMIKLVGVEEHELELGDRLEIIESYLGRDDIVYLAELFKEDNDIDEEEDEEEEE